MLLPPGYAEHFKMLCPFCRREVSGGTIQDGKLSVGFHANPICNGWTTADDIVQYLMFARLKENADAGRLERN